MKIKWKMQRSKNRNIIATAFKPWIMLKEEIGFSQTIIGLKPGRKAFYPPPEGSGNGIKTIIGLKPGRKHSIHYLRAMAIV